MKNSPLRPFPNSAYTKAKTFLFRHPHLHLFLHHTLCRLTLKYRPIPYTEWIRNHQKEMKKWNNQK